MVLGRRRVFIAGLAVFALASFLIGVAPSGSWLIAARALQGIGASVGLVVGGALAELISWRAGFFLNVPIGAAMMVAAVRNLPDTPRSTGRFDLPGALCATLGMGALVFGIVASTDAGWSDPVTVTSLVAGGGAPGRAGGQRSRGPSSRSCRCTCSPAGNAAGAYLARILFAGTMIGYFFFTTQFLQGVYGYSPLQAGLAFLPMTLVNFFVALPVPRLTARFGNAALLASGLALTLAGMTWLAQLTAATPYLTGVALPMVLIGVGQGLAFAPLTAAGSPASPRATPERHPGWSTPLINSAAPSASAVLVALSSGVGAATLTEPRDDRLHRRRRHAGRRARRRTRADRPGRSRSQSLCRPEAGRQRPVEPSICSRRMSACPACRPVSSIMCTRSHRIDGADVRRGGRGAGSVRSA